MRGKPSASTLLGKEGELVKWSGDGSQFIVQSGNVIDVYQAVRVTRVICAAASIN